MIDVLLLQFNVINLRNISRAGVTRTRRPTSACSSAYVYNGCLAWCYNVLL